MTQRTTNSVSTLGSARCAWPGNRRVSVIATANSHEPYARSSAKGPGNESGAGSGLPDAESYSPSRDATTVIGDVARTALNRGGTR
jgi:hypothetical protein